MKTNQTTTLTRLIEALTERERRTLYTATGRRSRSKTASEKWQSLEAEAEAIDRRNAERIEAEGRGRQERKEAEETITAEANEARRTGEAYHRTGNALYREAEAMARQAVIIRDTYSPNRLTEELLIEGNRDSRSRERADIEEHVAEARQEHDTLLEEAEEHQKTARRKSTPEAEKAIAEQAEEEARQEAEALRVEAEEAEKAGEEVLSHMADIVQEAAEAGVDYMIGNGASRSLYALDFYRTLDGVIAIRRPVKDAFLSARAMQNRENAIEKYGDAIEAIKAGRPTEVLPKAPVYFHWNRTRSPKSALQSAEVMVTAWVDDERRHKAERQAAGRYIAGLRGGNVYNTLHTEHIKATEEKLVEYFRTHAPDEVGEDYAIPTRTGCKFLEWRKGRKDKFGEYPDEGYYWTYKRQTCNQWQSVDEPTPDGQRPEYIRTEGTTEEDYESLEKFQVIAEASNLTERQRTFLRYILRSQSAADAETEARNEYLRENQYHTASGELRWKRNKTQPEHLRSLEKVGTKARMEAGYKRIGIKTASAKSMFISRLRASTLPILEAYTADLSQPDTTPEPERLYMRMMQARPHPHPVNIPRPDLFAGLAHAPSEGYGFLHDSGSHAKFYISELRHQRKQEEEARKNSRIIVDPEEARKNAEAWAKTHTGLHYVEECSDPKTAKATGRKCSFAD